MQGIPPLSPTHLPVVDISRQAHGDAGERVDEDEDRAGQQVVVGAGARVVPLAAMVAFLVHEVSTTEAVEWWVTGAEQSRWTAESPQSLQSVIVSSLL